MKKEKKYNTSIKVSWYSCPQCGNPKLLKIRTDTEAHNLIVYCKKCKREIIMDIVPVP